MPEITLPSINARAWLSLDETVERLFPTRIEDKHENQITIAAPLTSHGGAAITSLAAPPETQHCSLVWNVGDPGYARQNVRVTKVNHGHLETWEISPDGELEIIQRRSFVRVPEDTQAIIHFSDRSVDARVIDISEGGLRCITYPFPIRIEHYPCYADLVIANNQVLIAASIARIEENDEGDMELGIEFTGITDVHSNLIRRHVFSRQLQMRNEP